jgi:hypothetical protein
MVNSRTLNVRHQMTRAPVTNKRVRIRTLRLLNPRKSGLNRTLKKLSDKTGRTSQPIVMYRETDDSETMRWAATHNE